jgi:hypothetical protein
MSKVVVSAPAERADHGPNNYIDNKPDSEPTKLLYLPKGPQTDKHLPPGPFTGQFLRKADI